MTGATELTEAGQLGTPGIVLSSDGLGLLPERADQARVMTLTGEWSCTEERGHWYSPAAVREMLAAERERISAQWAGAEWMSSDGPIDIGASIRAGRDVKA